MKTIKLDALPDGGKKLQHEILFLAENLRLLDIQINSGKATETGMINRHFHMSTFSLNFSQALGKVGTCE